METTEQQNIDNAVTKREKEILSGKYCIKLVEQGKEVGRKEREKEILEIIEKLIGEHKKWKINQEYYKPEIHQIIIEQLQELKSQIQNNSQQFEVKKDVSSLSGEHLEFNVTSQGKKITREMPDDADNQLPADTKQNKEGK